MRRTIHIFFYLLALLIVGGLALLLYVLHSPKNLEAYIAGQIQAIVNRQLKPQLSFDNLKYEYPATVHIQHLRLVADDPANPGKTIDLVSADSGAVTLAEIPHIGKPIKIEHIYLDKPLLSLVSMSADNPDLVGFSDILTHKPTSHPTTEEDQDFSDILQIRLVQVSDGRIVYDPRIPGTGPMTLDQISTQLDFTPTGNGWYSLKLGINRKPVFTLAASTSVNLDSFQLKDINVQLKANVDQSNLTYLPPQVQQLLGDYQVSGRLEAVALGDLPIPAPEKMKMALSLDLQKAHATFGEYQIPIDRLQLAANIHDQQLELRQCSLNGFSGTATVTGTMALDEALDANLAVKVNGMKIQDIFNAREQAKPTTLSGQVSVDAAVRGPLQTIGDRINQKTTAPLPNGWASCLLTITEGRLMNFKRVRDVLSAIGVTEISENDTASVAADCDGDIIRINDLRYVGKFLAARGSGTVNLDRKIDLLLNAGPIERAQVLLGGIGTAISRVTDKIVAYRVRGTIDQPKITVEVGNGTVNKAGKEAGKFLGGVGSSISDWFK